MITHEELQAYVGGQIEIQNQQEGYCFRGEIATIAIEGENNSAELVVTFNWIAQLFGPASGIIPCTVDSVKVGWCKAENKPYRASLLIYGGRNIGPSEEGSDRYMFQSPVTGELVVLYPPDGSKLEKESVKC